MITEEFQQKYARLLDNLRALGSVAVAFSGGVDSSFLLHTAKAALVFAYVTLDIQGYRTGSMNETLAAKNVNSNKNP